MSSPYCLKATNLAKKHFQMDHSLYLETDGRSLMYHGIKLTPWYLETDGCSLMYRYMVGPTFVSDGGTTQVMARYDLDGSLNGRAMQKLGNDTEIQASVQSTPKDPMRNMLEFSMEQTGFDWTAGAKIGWQGTWLVNGSYTQEIS